MSKERNVLVKKIGLVFGNEFIIRDIMDFAEKDREENPDIYGDDEPVDYMSISNYAALLSRAAYYIGDTYHHKAIPNHLVVTGSFLKSMTGDKEKRFYYFLGSAPAKGAVVISYRAITVNISRFGKVYGSNYNKEKDHDWYFEESHLPGKLFTGADYTILQMARECFHHYQRVVMSLSDSTIDDEEIQKKLRNGVKSMMELAIENLSIDFVERKKDGETADV